MSDPLLTEAASTASRLSNRSYHAVAVECPDLEYIVQRIRRVEAFAQEYNVTDHISGVVGGMYGLLLQLAEWIVPPSDEMKRVYRQKISEVLGLLEASKGWFTSEKRADCEGLIHDLLQWSDDSDIGSGKLSALLSFANSVADHSVAAVVRTMQNAQHMTRVFGQLELEYSVFPRILPERRTFDVVVIETWLGRRYVDKIVDRACGIKIYVVGYPFEMRWWRSYYGSRNYTLARFIMDRAEMDEFLGVHTPESIDISQLSATIDYKETRGESSEVEDPVTKYDNRRSGKRDRVSVSGQIPENDLREAFYVGFRGPFYSFLTRSHRVPVVTDLIHGVVMKTVPLKPTAELEVDDYVLFREQSDRDIISLIAQVELGETLYQETLDLAQRWRKALRTLGSNIDEICTTLDRLGLMRSRATVRNWLTDDAQIGPGNDEDLEVIARGCKDEGFRGNVDRVIEAIKTIRASHIQAGFLLSDLLIKDFPEKASEVTEEGALVDLMLGRVWVVCVEEIVEDPQERGYLEVNRLLME